MDGCRCAGCPADGRLLAGGGRRLARLGASRPVRHGEGSEEPWFDADAVELLLVDVEHLALLHGQAAPALGRQPCGGDATRRPRAHAEHRRVHLDARRDPERRDVRRQGGGDVACRAVAAREQHEGRSRVREGARGRRRVGGARRLARRVDHDRVEPRLPHDILAHGPRGREHGHDRPSRRDDGERGERPVGGARHGAALGCRTLHRGPVAAGEARGAADAGHGIDDEAEHGQAAASPKYLRR